MIMPGNDKNLFYITKKSKTANRSYNFLWQIYCNIIKRNFFKKNNAKIN